MRPAEWLLLCGTMAVHLAYHLATGLVIDDAFITFRYSENIANGTGFVYNAGERVLGTTSPLWTLILAAAAYLRLPTIQVAIGLSILCSGVNALILRRIGHAIELGSTSWLVAISYALWPRSLMAETVGMESALFTLLTLLTFWLITQGCCESVTAAAAVALLVRPEGGLLLGIAVVWVMFSRPGRAVAATLIATGTLLPWFIFSTWYFGNPIPTSIAGKLALYGSSANVLPSRPVYVLAMHSPVGFVASLLAMVSGVLIWARHRQLRAGLLFTALVIVVYTITPTQIFWWYLAPIQPMLLLADWYALDTVCSRVRWTAAHRTFIVGLASIATVALGFFGNVTKYQFSSALQQQYETINDRIGAYMAENAAADQVVATQDIGYIGYYSRDKILDRDGLITPWVQEFNRRGDFFGVIEHGRPDWVVADTASSISKFIREERFLRAFELDTAFSQGWKSFEVYRRRKSIVSDCCGLTALREPLLAIF